MFEDPERLLRSTNHATQTCSLLAAGRWNSNCRGRHHHGVAAAASPSPHYRNNNLSRSMRPQSLLGLLAFSFFDLFRNCVCDHCIHVEQADNAEALRGVGLLRTMLRSVVLRHGAVTHVTLCVGERNLKAQAAYRAMGFTGFDSDGAGSVRAVLRDAALAKLRNSERSSYLEKATPGLIFTSLGSEEDGSRAACTETTMHEARRLWHQP